MRVSVRQRSGENHEGEKRESPAEGEVADPVAALEAGERLEEFRRPVSLEPLLLDQVDDARSEGEEEKPDAQNGRHDVNRAEGHLPSGSHV